MVRGSQHEAQRDQATLGTHSPSLEGFEAHSKVYAREESSLNGFLVSYLHSRHYRINQGFSARTATIFFGFWVAFF